MMDKNILKTSEHLKTRLGFRKYFELLASFTGNKLRHLFDRSDST